MQTISPQNALLSGLNNEQLSAVTWPAEPALVLAGAGSGKTKVLTTRIAWLLHTGQASLHTVMAVTFTNKAAKEMRARLEAMLPLNIRAMWLGTFHGLCHRFLRAHHKEAGLSPSFQILDGSDQLALVKRLLKSLNIAEETLAPRALQGFINAQKEAGLRAEALAAGNPFEQRLIECYAEYDRLCRREGVADFAELMLRSYEILQGNDILRTHYQNRFSHILVDEFQDTNKLQYDWLKLLAGRHAAVFAVGDDDQSIYRFRGARVGNMADFMREFQVASPIKLEQNYRSVGNILAAANAVIAHNGGRLGKNLRTEAENGEKIRFLSAYTDSGEAEFVVDEIKALHRDGLALEQAAVLYRGNAQSRVLEQALFAAGLPYKIYGGLRFYERQEVKHALAYLRLAVNPGDDNALLRVINVPARGIGSRTVENIQAAAAEEGIPLWQAACRVAVKNGKVAAFVRLIENLRGRIGQVRLPETVAEAIRASGLYKHYQNQKTDQQDRLDNLDELIRAAEEFRPEESAFETMPADAADSPAFPVLAFLSNAALESGENQAAANESAVQLMTVHAAKGLEFDAVFLTGMEEGRFPSELSLAEPGGLEEERRLMYVAITRARRRLYISMAQQRRLHGQEHFGTPSRFVEEIPPDLLHLLTPVSKPRFPVPEGRPPQCGAEQPKWAEPADYGGFRIGQNVRHPKFGTGVIIEGEHKAGSARLTINFGKQGIKVLDAKFAKLEAV